MPDRLMDKRDAMTVGQAFDVMLDASDSVHRSATFLLKVAVPLIMGLILVSAVQFYQRGQVNEKLTTVQNSNVELKTQIRELKESNEKTQDAAAKAQTAAESADASLKGAIAASQRSTNDTTEAIKRINDIYDTCVVRKEC